MFIFTLLMSVLITPYAFGQTVVTVQKERAMMPKEIPMPDYSLRSTEKTAWPDSTLTYNAEGKKIGKSLFFYDSANNLTRQEDWVFWNSGAVTEWHRWIYTYDGDIVTEAWYNSYSGEMSESPVAVTRTHKEKKVFPYYDAEAGRVYLYGPFGARYIGGDGFEETYDNHGNLVSVITRSEEYRLYKIDISYDAKKNPVLIEWKDADENDIVGMVPYKEVYQWDTKGNIVYYEEWEVDDSDGELKLSYSNSYEYTYDSYGNETKIIKEDSKTIKTFYTPGMTPQIQNYSWKDNGWGLNSYEIYYPMSSSSVENDNNEPVGDKNKGGFDIIVNIPAESVAGGSFIINLPDGFTLDTDNTKLTVDFNQFELVITKQETNAWMLEIKPKALKSASLQSQNASTILAHVAYLVDDTKEKGSYNITLNNIRFTTPEGNMVLEPEMVVPVLLDRWPTDTEKIQTATIHVFCDGNILTVDSPAAETINIYSVTGTKIYQGVKPAGKMIVRIPDLSGKMIIVKGSSNWVKKVLVK